MRSTARPGPAASSRAFSPAFASGQRPYVSGVCAAAPWPQPEEGGLYGAVQGRGIVENVRDANVVEDWDIQRLKIGEAIIGLPGGNPSASSSCEPSKGGKDMDMQKRPVIRVLNALWPGLGVAAGGLVICGLLLACVPTPTPTEGDVDASRPAGAESSEGMDADQSSEIGTSNEDQHLKKKYEEDIASGAATAETYLELAEYWMDRGDADRAERVLRQGLEDTGGDTDIGKALEELSRRAGSRGASAREVSARYL